MQGILGFVSILGATSIMTCPPALSAGLLEGFSLFPVHEVRPYPVQIVNQLLDRPVIRMALESEHGRFWISRLWGPERRFSTPRECYVSVERKSLRHDGDRIFFAGALAVAREEGLVDEFVDRLMMIDEKVTSGLRQNPKQTADDLVTKAVQHYLNPETFQALRHPEQAKKRGEGYQPLSEKRFGKLGEDLDAYLRGCREVASQLVWAMSGPRWRWERHRLSLPGSDFGDVDHHYPYRPPVMRDFDLRFSDFVRGNLNGWIMTGTNLDGSLFIGTQMEGIDLTHSQVRRADLRSANLKNADLRSANLEGSKFRGAVLVGAKFDETTKLPFSRTEATRRGMVEADSVAEFGDKLTWEERRSKGY